MKRRILVTGGSGFIGSNLLTALAERLGPEGELVAASREPRAFQNLPVQEIVSDLTNAGECARLVEEVKPDIVIHLAAISSVVAGYDAEDLIWQTNFLPTWNLALAIRRSPHPVSLVFASSAEVYGASFKTHPVATETGPAEPINAYARSKYASELMLRDVLREKSCTVMRLFNSIGPGQDERFVVASFAAQIARMEAGLIAPLLRVGNISAERDFLDVLDTVNAFVSVVADNADGAPQFRVFNVASGVPRAIADLIDELRRQTRISFSVEVDQERMRPNDIQRAVGDAAQLTAQTGWRPTREWSDTVERTLGYWRSAVLAAH